MEVRAPGKKGAQQHPQTPVPHGNSTTLAMLDQATATAAIAAAKGHKLL